MHLFGREWTRDQLERYVGNIGQVGGVVRRTATEGTASGIEVVEFRTGTGLRFEVLPTCGMGIGKADFYGLPLAWQADNDYVHPVYRYALEPRLPNASPGGLFAASLALGAGASAGVFTKASMGASVGEPAAVSAGTSTNASANAANVPPSPTDQVVTSGIQPTAISPLMLLPARQVFLDAEWHDDNYQMWVRGSVVCRDSTGATVQLTRQVGAWLGESHIHIADTVENIGYAPVSYLISYQINLGYPLIGPESRLLTAPHPIVPGNVESVAGVERWNSFDLPTPGYVPQAYHHALAAGADGMAAIAVAAPQAGSAGLALQIRYDARSLPFLTQVKNCSETRYLLSLCPSNFLPQGIPALNTTCNTEPVWRIGPRESRRHTVELYVQTMR